MADSQQPPNTATCLPEALRQGLEGMSNIDMSSVSDIVNMNQLFGQQRPFRRLLPLAPLHHRAMLLSPSPTLFANPSPSQDQALQSQSGPLSQSRSQSVVSVLSVLSVLQSGNKSHWSANNINVLIKAIHAHNLYKHKTNQDKGKAWQDVCVEVNYVYMQQGQQSQSMQGIKEKWKQIAQACKWHDCVLAGSSGHVEFRTNQEQMIDEVLHADIAYSYGWNRRDEAE